MERHCLYGSHESCWLILMSLNGGLFLLIAIFMFLLCNASCDLFCELLDRHKSCSE
ncbi:hypothetical protein KSP40_PGU019103 [Platanthera guangdongensis]|uniref:ATP synthase F0 subunit 8 n=1 Tax=Platanthera guangdongensis TaxID=2320717 RepID=A0ABR2LJA3_9ASPA